MMILAFTKCFAYFSYPQESGSTIE